MVDNGLVLIMNRKYYFILLTIFVFSGFISAQEEVGRSVISIAGGSYSTDSISYSFTIGEPIIGTKGNSEGYITQGFQQPADEAIIIYDALIVDEMCPEIANGSVLLSDFKGCISDEYSVLWENGETGRGLVNLNTGWYYFSVTACDETVEDSVFVGLTSENPCGMDFYTAFSPNNDGANDTWIIDNIDVTPNDKNDISFYNIWGQEVISFTDYDNSQNVWDGKDKNGTDLPEGTYYFVLTLSFDTYSGYIELTR